MLSGQDGCVCGKFGTKRPQVQILSPRPHLRRSQPCEGFRGSGQAQPEGTKGNIEGTQGNNDQAGWLTTEARDGDKLRSGPGRRSATARTVLAASGADGRPLKLNVPGPVDGCVLFAPNGGPQLPSAPCRDVPARSARLGTIFRRRPLDLLLARCCLPAAAKARTAAPTGARTLSIG